MGSDAPSRIRRAAATARAARGRARKGLAWTRTGLERNLIARRAQADVPASRILCYHSIGTPECGINDVTPRAFGRHLEIALNAGYRFVAAAELASASATTDGETAPRLALTFDDGLSTVLTHAAPVLRDLGVPWTAFVVTDWADGRHPFGGDVVLGWRDVERLLEFGASVGSHSVTHPNFGRLKPGQTADELSRSRQVIRDRTGVDTTEFAIPFGQSGNWTAHAGSAATEAGYRTVYAQSAHRRPVGTVPRTFVTRFDSDTVFSAALGGAFDAWEEWF